jgi:P27 family predicted phage terminase small subunit
MGRKRLPTQILKLRGSKRLYDRPKNEPVPVMKKPKPPKWLKGDAKKVWDDKADLLFEQGTLTLVDDIVFALFCESYASYMKIYNQVSKEGFTIEANNGKQVRHPLAGMLITARDAVNKIASEFGMSASSRSAINLPKPKPKEVNKAKQWIESQKGA